MKLDKLVELLQDEETAKELFNMSIEEAQAELAKKGLDFTTEELEAFAKGVKDAEVDGSDELNEDQLANVAGGSYKSDCYNAGKRAGKVLRQVFTIAAPFAVGLW